MTASTLVRNLTQTFFIRPGDPFPPDCGLEVLNVGILANSNLGLKIRPDAVVQGIEVWGAGWPQSFVPEFDVGGQPGLDSLCSVAGGHGLPRWFAWRDRGDDLVRALTQAAVAAGGRLCGAVRAHRPDCGARG